MGISPKTETRCHNFSFFENLVFENLDGRKTRNCGSAFQFLGKCPYPIGAPRALRRSLSVIHSGTDLASRPGLNVGYGLGFIYRDMQRATTVLPVWRKPSAGVFQSPARRCNVERGRGFVSTMFTNSSSLTKRRQRVPPRLRCSSYCSVSPAVHARIYAPARGTPPK